MSDRQENVQVQCECGQKMLITRKRIEEKGSKFNCLKCGSEVSAEPPSLQEHSRLKKGDGNPSSIAAWLSSNQRMLAVLILGFISISNWFSIRSLETNELHARIAKLEKRIALISEEQSAILVDGTVFANRFVLVDKDGNGRAEVGYGPGSNGNYGPGFWVYDIEDNEKVSAGLFQDGFHRTRLEMFNAFDQKIPFFSFMANEAEGIGSAIFKREVIVHEN